MTLTSESLGSFHFIIDLSRLAVRAQIPGEPQAWLRPGRSGKGARARTFDPRANQLAKQNIRDWLTRAQPRLGVDPPDHLHRFGVIYLFATNMWTTDLSNYVKLVEDAVNEFVWKDDRQVDESYIRLVRGVYISPRSELTFYRLEDKPIETGR